MRACARAHVRGVMCLKTSELQDTSFIFNYCTGFSFCAPQYFGNLCSHQKELSFKSVGTT